MQKNIYKKYTITGIAICCLFFKQIAFAQTDIDGIMMQKNFFCVGPTVGYSSWKNYWEGTFKRDNANLGTVSSTAAMMAQPGSRKCKQLLNLHCPAY